ncbi:MAG: hypothetical protein ACKVOT_11465 [Polaromonas sp.]
MNCVLFLLRSAVAGAALALAGCAGFNAPAAPPFRDPALSMPGAQALIVPGQSTRQDVAAALGPATVLTFDSGFEVWAYRTPPSRTASASAELVILFGPSGVVRKTRLRTAP